MELGKAMALFRDINSDQYSVYDKALAIYTVMNMPTHNSITKDAILEALRWVWNEHFDMITEDEV